LLAVVFASVVFAAPIAKVLAPLNENGEIIPGSYIVRIKKSVEIATAKQFAESFSAGRFWSFGEDVVFTGFSGYFTDAQVLAIRERVDVVAYVDRDGVARTSARQDNVPSWGLGAVSSENSVSPGYYVYPDHAGAGSVVYIIDTGIRCSHTDLVGRCRFGARYGAGESGQNSDGNGHGTHCAGTAVGTSYGVAKFASVVAVGVLGPSGSGAWADVISGINFAANDCGANNCVGSMSLGGGATPTVDDAANAFVSATRFMACAAGNNNGDAVNFSPARAADVYSVMATDSNANKASYSNYGAVCSIWAPGSAITSAWHTSDTAINTISGTSMACPHVAGAAALAFTSGHGSTDRFAIENYLNLASTNNTIGGVPANTVNRFLHIDESF